VVSELVVLGTLAVVAACSGPQRGGGDGWARARGVAEHYLRGKYGTPPTWQIEAELAGTPYVFQVRSPGEFAVVVHAGAVVTQRGLGALDRFLREGRSVEHRTTTLDELMVLLQALEALPAIPRPRSYLSKSASEVLRPRLELGAGGAATLVLHYRTEDPGEGEAGSVIEWRLVMEPGAMPAWHRRVRAWDRERESFRDVDHAK
jgi:hypothetical protein